MNQALEILHLRNRLLAKLLWFSLLLGLLVDIAIKAETITILVLATVGSSICLLITLLNWRRKFTTGIMYLVVIGLGVLSYIMISTSPKLTTYFMVYYSLAIASLYHNYRPVLLSGLIGLIFTNYFFFAYSETMFAGFNDQGLVSLNLFLILITSVLVAQSRIGANMRSEIEENHAAVWQAKNRMDEVFQQVRDSVAVTSQFSSQLHENMAVTGRISNEVGIAFSEIASGIESQTTSVSDISQSIQTVDQHVHEVAGAAESMKELSEANSEVIKHGSEQMSKLSGEVDQVHAIIQSVVSLMNELNEQNKQIGNIVEAIHDISAQTNLLALNAAIEAARAGEHGRGFAVVSTEVRKLAENSRQSTEEIAAILGEIQQKTKQAVEQVYAGQTAVFASKEAADRVGSVFADISKNIELEVTQASKIEQMTQRLKESSERIVREITSVSSITQQTAASVEEVLASVEEQSQRVQQIIDSFEQLESHTKGLQELTGQQA